MKRADHIPKDKFDCLALERAGDVGFPNLNGALEELLEWLQDANWPVAQPTAALLANAGTEIAPPIKVILRGADGSWKYWLLELLIPNLAQDVLRDLKDDLTRLADYPSEDDQSEEVDHLARQVVLKCF